MGEERKVYKVLVGKPEGKRPLGRPRRRWEDGIRMNLGEIGLGGVDWFRLAQDRYRWRAVVSAVMNLRVPAPRTYILYPVTFILRRLVWCTYKPQVSFCRNLAAVCNEKMTNLCNKWHEWSLYAAWNAWCHLYFTVIGKVTSTNLLSFPGSESFSIALKISFLSMLSQAALKSTNK
jgi:hypothetical protein